MEFTLFLHNKKMKTKMLQQGDVLLTRITKDKLKGAVKITPDKRGIVLAEGEIIREGDQYFSCLNLGTWCKTWAIGSRVTRGDDHRRRIKSKSKSKGSK